MSESAFTTMGVTSVTSGTVVTGIDPAYFTWRCVRHDDKVFCENPSLNKNEIFYPENAFGDFCGTLGFILLVVAGFTVLGGAIWTIWTVFENKDRLNSQREWLVELDRKAENTRVQVTTAGAEKKK